MQNQHTNTCKRMIAMIMVILMIVAIAANQFPVYAADGTLNFQAGKNIHYGDYVTAKMTVDGDNTAYCVQPTMPTPASGTYEYNLLPGDSELRKALFYLPGGYGYEEQNIAATYLSGWSEDDRYVIGHLTASYVYSGYDAGSGSFWGAPQNYIDKAVELANVIRSLPNPPASFRAFIIPSTSRQTVAGSWYEIPYGWIELRKTSANPGISDGNESYSLEGAKYGIYEGEDLVETLVTDANGYAKSGNLEIGSYVVKELAASKGYSIDTRSYEVTVTSDTTSALDVKEIPLNNPIDLVLEKLDAELGTATPQGAASFADAEFTIKFYTTQSDTDPAESGLEPARTWIFKTDAEGTLHFTEDYFLSGDEFYYASDGTTICLPLGTVTIQETKAPEGYLLNETVFVQKIAAESDTESISVYQTTEVEEQVIRGDLELVKVSDQDQNRLANIPFTITSNTTQESHTILTDQNGYASTSTSWNKHTSNTNRGETAEDGVWFGESEPDDSKGALLYDTYTVEEQRCEENEGRNLLSFEVQVYRDSVTIDLGTLTNDKVELSTSAVDQESGSQMAYPDDSVTIVDTVEMEGLQKGKEYRLVGSLMNQETGDPIENNGKPVTAEKTFTAKKSIDSVEVTFTLDASDLAGVTVVCFEELWQGEVKLAQHTDLSDPDQSVLFPSIGTTASDADDGDQEAHADEEVTITDEIAYKNLVPGLTFRMDGVLMDAETGEQLLIDGKPVTSQLEFVPEESSGTVEVSFTFNGSGLAGNKLVVFEKLYLVTGGTEVPIVSHEDLESAEQSILLSENPPEVSEVSPPVKTGDDTPLTFYFILGGAALLLLACTGGYLIYKRKRNQKDS